MVMMTFEEARSFIAESSKTGSILGLESICNLMSELGNIQDQLPVIHIAGTNGKGSTGAYLQAIFEQAGFTTSRYCSPAVFDPLEVFQYCGTTISESEYAHVMSQVKTACDILVSKGKAMPTVFEIETAAAFVWFYQKKPDIVLLEVGMGGETDATNIVKNPLASVITTISRDHMGFLGENVEDIAAVKAGIIKEKCPVFSAPQQSGVEQVLFEHANRKQAELRMVDENVCELLKEKVGQLSFSYKGKNYVTGMAGLYQMKNAALAIEVAEYLFPKLMEKKSSQAAVEGSIEERISKEEIHKEEIGKEEIIKKGIEAARWAGRFEVIQKEPLIIMDGAHNEDAAKQLAQTVHNCFPKQKLTYIIGVLADKEHEKMLELMLPYADQVYTVTPNNPRALDGKFLAEEVRNLHKDVESCDSVTDALKKALQQAKEKKEPVLAFGSLSYLGELKRAIEVMK